MVRPDKLLSRIAVVLVVVCMSLSFTTYRLLGHVERIHSQDRCYSPDKLPE